MTLRQAWAQYLNAVWNYGVAAVLLYAFILLAHANHLPPYGSAETIVAPAAPTTEVPNVHR